MNVLNFLLGFRKFTIIILVMVSMIAMLLAGYIEGSEFADTIKVTVVAFMGTNLGEHLIKVGKEWLESLKKKHIDKKPKEPKK